MTKKFDKLHGLILHLFVRYYLWEYSDVYGWRQMGDCEGYKTLKEIEKDKFLDIKNIKKYRILKATVFKENN